MVFVLATSQLVQISVVAVVTGAIYLILGLIVLTPALLKEWTHVSKLGVRSCWAGRFRCRIR